MNEHPTAVRDSSRNLDEIGPGGKKSKKRNINQTTASWLFNNKYGL